MIRRKLASPPRRAAAAVAGLALAALALHPSPPSQPAPSVPAAAREEPPFGGACPELRSAPPPPAPAPMGAICSARAAVHAALTRADVPGEPELEELRATVARGLAEPACFAAFEEELADAGDCGIVYDAVAIRLLGDPTHVAEAAAALARPTRCQWKLASALREATHVAPPIASAVHALTRSPSEDVRGSAWLTLGTLARLARGAGERDVASCLDHVVTAALAAPPPDTPRELVVRAAGNAGCEGCRAALQDDAEHGDPRARRAAVSALRFLATAPDVAALCRSLGADPDPAVRAAAAFALRHEVTQPATRLACLVAAAAGDEAPAVAREAVVSLADLAGHDDAEHVGVGALVQVARASRHPGVRADAAGALRAFASDEAIADVLASR